MKHFSAEGFDFLSQKYMDFSLLIFFSFRLSLFYDCFGFSLFFGFFEIWMKNRYATCLWFPFYLALFGGEKGSCLGTRLLLCDSRIFWISFGFWIYNRFFFLLSTTCLVSSFVCMLSRDYTCKSIVALEDVLGHVENNAVDRQFQKKSM
jgi:hypothetical protein